ncbi:leucine-rich repeat protein [Prevotella disiens]|uniref:leucine-rich repeat protein n=1 Tax=Prevotella disiens TaxID=28130 RepID=UPI003369D422
MKQNYNNKAKHRSAWLTLVLLLMTALPITAQNAGDRFQVDNGYWYEVVDAANYKVKVTYGNANLDKAKAKQQVLADATADLLKEWKAYNGTVPTTEKEEFILEKYFSSKTPEADTKHNIPVVVIPPTVKHNNIDWKVVAIGSYAFINERGFGNVELPATIEAIEDCAFYQCSVTMMNFPASLKYIGWRAFYKTNLAPYSIQKKGNDKKFIYRKYSDQPIKILGETAIGPQAFEGNFSKSKFECPNITFVGYQAFKGTLFTIKQNKTDVSIPATAKIGEPTEDATIKAMYNNLVPAITDYRSGVESFAEFGGSVSLAEGPTIIPKGMFKNAFTNLAKFVIPYSVKNSIEEEAFENAGILSFNDLSVVTKIGARAFKHGCISGDFEILENVTEIGDEAFACNGKLTGFTVKGNTNCKIGDGIVRGCYNLEYLDLRNMNSTEAKNNLKNLSREFDTDTNPNKTITAGLPTHTVVYLPDAQGITIADGQDVNFVKSDGKCTKLSLQDGAEYEFLCDIKANEVVYNRCNMTINSKTINRGYNTDLTVNHYEGDNSLTSYRDFSSFANGKNCFTVFLPYAVTLKPGIRAYNLNLLTTRKGSWNEYTEQYDTDEIYVFKSIPDGSKLEANRPYLLRITDGGNSHSSKDFIAKNSPVPVVIAASGNDKYPKSGRLKPRGFVPATSDQTFCFYGSTEKSPRMWNEDINSDENNPYTLGHDENGNDMWKRRGSKSDVTALLPPFRGFIMPKLGTPTAAKEFILLSEDNQTAGINDVTNDADAQQGAQRIYTMDGRYVGTNFDSLPSGIYIMKGKKTLKTK